MNSVFRDLQKEGLAQPVCRAQGADLTRTVQSKSCLPCQPPAAQAVLLRLPRSAGQWTWAQQKMSLSPAAVTLTSFYSSHRRGDIPGRAMAPSFHHPPIFCLFAGVMSWVTKGRPCTRNREHGARQLETAVDKNRRGIYGDWKLSLVKYFQW